MLAAGEDHTLALGDDGGVYAWGAGGRGQLGLGGTSLLSLPFSLFWRSSLLVCLEAVSHCTRGERRTIVVRAGVPCPLHDLTPLTSLLSNAPVLVFRTSLWTLVRVARHAQPAVAVPRRRAPAQGQRDRGRRALQRRAHGGGKPVHVGRGGPGAARARRVRRGPGTLFIYHHTHTDLSACPKSDSVATRFITQAC